MAKEKKEEELNILLDEENMGLDLEKIPIKKEDIQQELMNKKVSRRKVQEENELINCLTNEKVIVRFISKARGTIIDPKHVLFGNMAPKSKVQFPVPMLRSGQYADVLTKNEKNFLEWKLGLEPNALSVYNRTNNFWDDSNTLGIGRVELIKGDNYFDKSKPIDYIKLAILRSYTDIIAPSLQVLQDKPKSTYKFVIISDTETAKEANNRVSMKAKAYREFGKIESDKEKMRVIIELMDGRPTAPNTKIEYLQGKIGDLLESNTRLFLSTIQDPLLDTKVLIKKAIEAGVISNRGNFLYYKEDNSPLCSNGEEPTLNIAAKFLNLPKNQELKFSIEAKIKE